MKITFYKYQGTGNDFVMIDNRQHTFPKNDTKLVNRLCDRKFGIGADGLILLENSEEADFKMVYFNADGNESSMCGNGGRCLVAFAEFLGVIKSECTFVAVDGLHHAKIYDGIVSLAMQDVPNIDIFDTYSFLNTGSPHHVQLVSDLPNLDVKVHGEKLRYGKYGNAGSNINFVAQESPDVFAVRTYERGVEDETLSCGTGVTAVALAMHETKKTSSNKVTLKTPGGELQVSFEKNGQGYKNIHLVGPATYVFSGAITA
ncbi:diaminopimelate epimerase [Galbibacter mesophilus]|uniref:diaminopimelate epimerase n=1 Tax=Galbibacter mesophilus TaxID=379069 RepID=UPI0019200EC5|nr:diaminopimelate epimerase [Galbibacter mesophilus]MCM5663777.1 diaminopimelate epimerase [Galbibacter mesophilus]